MKNVFHTKSQSYLKHKRKSFALIYVLLFIVLLMIAVSATWVTGLADLRLAQRTEYSAEATQLAKSAIDDGWVKYKKDLLGSTYDRPFDLALTFPTSACAASNATYYRNYPDRDPIATPEPKPLSPAPSITNTLIGVYDYKICTGSANPTVRGGTTIIEGIGYYKGNKITLQATVAHPNDIAIMGIDSLGNPIQTGWNHDNDYLTIYQAGPSK